MKWRFQTDNAGYLWRNFSALGEEYRQNDLKFLHWRQRLTPSIGDIGIIAPFNIFPQGHQFSPLSCRDNCCGGCPQRGWGWTIKTNTFQAEIEKTCIKFAFDPLQDHLPLSTGHLSPEVGAPRIVNNNPVRGRVRFHPWVSFIAQNPHAGQAGDQISELPQDIRQPGR